MIRACLNSRWQWLFTMVLGNLKYRQFLKGKDASKFRMKCWEMSVLADAGRKTGMCLVSAQVPRSVAEKRKLSPTSISLTERAIATLAVGFLRLMIADIPLSGEHEEAFVAVDNPKKVTPRDKSRRNRHPT
jgi:hypothetical protein